MPTGAGGALRLRAPLLDRALATLLQLVLCIIDVTDACV
jgi:hypothetical protein